VIAVRKADELQLLVTVRCGANGDNRENCGTRLFRVFSVVHDRGDLRLEARGNGVHADRAGVISGAGSKGTRRVLRPQKEARRQPDSFGFAFQKGLRGVILRAEGDHGVRHISGDDLLREIQRARSSGKPGRVLAHDGRGDLSTCERCALSTVKATHR
jgi:hypothetical protein